MDPLLTSAALSALAATGGSWAGTAWFLHAFGTRRRLDRPVDAIIVAGCPPLSDGTPSPALTRRVEAGALLVKERLAPRLVISGANDEARAGATVARRMGVGDDHLLLETQATHTVGNARHTAALLPDARSVAVVSDAYHLLRCRLAFAEVFDEVWLHDAGGARAEMALREVAGLLAHPWRARRDDRR